MSAGVRMPNGLRSLISLPGTLIDPSPVSSSVLPSMSPLSRADAARKTFIVEPASTASVKDRARVSAKSSSRKRFGSKPGDSARASTSPVFGSSVRTRPPFAPRSATAAARAASAAPCIAASRVKATSPPSTRRGSVACSASGRLRASRSTSTVRGWPISHSFSICSTPRTPLPSMFAKPIRAAASLPAG